jgi:predicted component of viral defense system (DUF524 family)
MTVIETQQKVIKAFAEPIIKRLINRVIRRLQNSDITLSGIENGNTWDDICIQVQSQLSSYWTQYEAVIDGYLESELSKLALHEQMAIWFQTEEGQQAMADELFNLEEKEGVLENKETIYNQTKVIEHLFTKIWEAADNWSNSRIRGNIG